MRSGRNTKIISPRAFFLIAGMCLALSTLAGSIARPPRGPLKGPLDDTLNSSTLDTTKTGTIDSVHSSLKIRVSKTGLFSAFAHNHEVDAPIESGEVTAAERPSVELRVDARKLHVLDPELSADTRAEIQKTMLGPQVLDTERYPEIHFHSTAVESQGIDRWLVSGNLDLHGQTQSIAVDVTLKDGVYKGSSILKQTKFGITPVTVAGGTVKVKDDLKIEFQIALSQ
jgi:polyisoprenoid-binding protein YceI